MLHIAYLLRLHSLSLTALHVLAKAT